VAERKDSAGARFIPSRRSLRDPFSSGLKRTAWRGVGETGGCQERQLCQHVQPRSGSVPRAIDRLLASIAEPKCRYRERGYILSRATVRELEGTCGGPSI